MKRNPLLSSLPENYLFQEMAKRILVFKKNFPNQEILSLGVGDTTLPLPHSFSQILSQAALDLEDPHKYIGYGPEEGLEELREQITTSLYSGIFASDEIFISDGANSDLTRLMFLFEERTSFVIQDPSYPVYADAGRLIKNAHITYISDFFKELASVPDRSVLFLCSPNNPTGTVFTKEELEYIVRVAISKQMIIILDVAYRAFIQGDLPKSIYEIEGADTVAIEVGSFSKMAGFSGVRLGWTVVPKALLYENGKKVWSDFHRIITTTFNGASIISQKAGLHVLTQEGLRETEKLVSTYLHHAHLLKKSIEDFPVTGGEHSPYIWVKTPYKDSWEAFDHFLNRHSIVVTPGSGFGPEGQGYVRLSGLASFETVQKACTCLNKI